VNITDSNDVEKPYFGPNTDDHAAVSVIVTYCKNQCNGSGNKDVITIAYTYGSPIMVTNTLAGKPISRSSRLLPNLRAHARKGDWKITSIEVTNTTVMPNPVMNCDGECSVVIHTCATPGSNCTPK